MLLTTKISSHWHIIFVSVENDVYAVVLSTRSISFYDYYR